MRQQAKKLITGIMEQYTNAVEGCVMAVGWFAGEVARLIWYYGRYLLAGLVIMLAWLSLAVTMPVWYLPYKYFTGKGEERKCRQGNKKRYRK